MSRISRYDQYVGWVEERNPTFMDADKRQQHLSAASTLLGFAGLYPTYETRMTGDTVWLSLGQMTTLFQRDKSVISRHIRNIFEEGELARDRVVANFATTAADGKSVSRDID